MKNPATPRAVAPQIGLPVFPGAEGFGTRTPAGRGGKVIEVTSLADDGPGTLRAALGAKGPRVIVFRTGGTIELKSHLFVSDPFVTVAGHTAPGDGICLKDAGLIILTHDVLIQHLRIRSGCEGPVNPENNDCLVILGKHDDVAGAYNVVLDHLSVSWGEDENLSTWYGPHDITISNCIISEGLNRGRHPKGEHSAGLLVGDGSYHVSVHHNLMAHNFMRNPLITDGGTHDIVNNVSYNWGWMPAEIIDYHSNTFVNFVGNYFIPGSDSQPNYSISMDPRYTSGIPKICAKGNIGPRRLKDDLDEFTLVAHGRAEADPAPPIYQASVPFEVHPVTALAADKALESVLANAGAIVPIRDTVDARVVEDVRNKTGNIIDSPKDVGGYPRLARGTPLPDGDHDGMPDEWEKANGFDPSEARDGDHDDDGYTNLEEYLHSLLK